MQNSGSATTTSINVNRGDSVYVFVAYGCAAGSIRVQTSTPGVTDSSNNIYKQAAIKQNPADSTYPAQEIWYADNVPANPALTVSVAFTGGSTFYIFTAVQISGSNGAGSIDVVSSGATGNTSPSSDPITTVNSSDLVIACDCSVRGTGTVTSGGGFTYNSNLSGPSGPTGGEDVYLNIFYDDAAAAGLYNSELSYPVATPYALISVAVKASVTWREVGAKPLVIVSPVGVTNYGSGITNNGADFGPDTLNTDTSGIQEALNSIASTGGTIYCNRGAYVLNGEIAFTGSHQRLEFEPGSTLTFEGGLAGIVPDWSSPTYSLAKCLILMGAPLQSDDPAPYSHQEVIGNGVQIDWGTNSAIDGFQIVSPGPQSSNGYTGPGGEDFLIEGVVSTGYIAECFSVHAQYQDSPNVISQMTRHIVVRRFYDTRSAVSTGGSGFSVGGNVFDMLVEDVEIDLSQACGGTGLSNCFIGGWQGWTSNVVVRRCRFISNGGLPDQPQASQVLELQGNALTGTTTGGCTDITIEDTLFDSGASSGSQAAGYGGAYLDDSDDKTATGYLNRVRFKNCQWRFCGMTLQSSGSTPGYFVFEGNQPGAFYDYYGTSLARMQGRPTLQGPNLSASGQLASSIQVQLPKSTNTNLAVYQPPTGIVGQFRINVCVSAYSADSSTVTISYHDPKAGTQSIVMSTTFLSGGEVWNAVITIVADSTAQILVEGYATDYPTSLFGSATIEQVG
jgi:hypothetical protein